MGPNAVLSLLCLWLYSLVSGRHMRQCCSISGHGKSATQRARDTFPLSLFLIRPFKMAIHKPVLLLLAIYQAIVFGTCGDSVRIWGRIDRNRLKQSSRRCLYYLCGFSIDCLHLCARGLCRRFWCAWPLSPWAYSERFSFRPPLRSFASLFLCS